MTPRPTPAQIVAEFEQEIARTPRWAYVDRGLLQRLVDDWRRLARLCGEGEGSSLSEFHPDQEVEISRDNTAHVVNGDGVWRCALRGVRIETRSLLGRMTWAQTKDKAIKPWPAWPCQTCVGIVWREEVE